MDRLKGKRALITGAGAGIGLAAAELFAAEGAKIAVVEIQREGGQAAADAVNAAGGEAVFLRADVADPDQMQAAFDAAVEAFGGLDIVYNNAGGATARDGNIAEVPLDEFWRTIGVDLFGTFLGCRLAVAPLERAGGGTIINTTSIRAIIGTLGAHAYTSAKGGVLTLTRALALELAPQNIRVNALCPTVVATPMLEAFLPGMAGDHDEAMKRFRATIPLARMPEPEDVAAAALFLVSDEARMITGVALPVDGGQMAM